MPNATADSKKSVFFTDIDGTLINSHRRKYEGKIIWAEYINGKKQAYIPGGAFTSLKKLDIEIVPVTSRSVNQFIRLTEFLKSLKVRRALVNNGSLLVPLSGKTDGETKRFNIETMKDCAAYAESMENAFHTLQTTRGIRNLYAALPCFISAACDDIGEVKANLPEDLPGALRIFCERNKLYIMPEIISKGRQIERFCQTFGIKRKISAGDSENDISMLETADLCFCPPDIAECFATEGKRVVCGGFFTDDIVKELDKRMWLL